LHDAYAGEWNAGGTGPIARILPFSLITAIAGRRILDETYTCLGRRYNP
jgi:hypothetical protein